MINLQADRVRSRLRRRTTAAMERRSLACFALPSVCSRKSVRAAVVAFCPQIVIVAIISQRRPNTATSIREDIPGNFNVAKSSSNENSQPFHCIRKAISKIPICICGRAHRPAGESIYYLQRAIEAERRTRPRLQGERSYPWRAPAERRRRRLLEYPVVFLSAARDLLRDVE